MCVTSSLPSILSPQQCLASLPASFSSPAQMWCLHTWTKNTCMCNAYVQIVSKFPPPRLPSTLLPKLLILILIEQHQTTLLKAVIDAAAFHKQPKHRRAFWGTSSEAVDTASQICFSAPRVPSTSLLNYALLFTIFLTQENKNSSKQKEKQCILRVEQREASSVMSVSW